MENQVDALRVGAVVSWDDSSTGEVLAVSKDRRWLFVKDAMTRKKFELEARRVRVWHREATG